MKARTILMIVFLYISLLLAGIGLSAALFVNFAKAENKTTDNLAGSMGNMTASGGTSYGTGSGCQQGKYCTSGTQGGGGTYTSSFNVPLTEKEYHILQRQTGKMVNSYLTKLLKSKRYNSTKDQTLKLNYLV